MDQTEKKIIKCLKSYLAGKKHMTDNKSLAYDYFKQCIRILNYLRENNITIVDKYLDVIDDTETECAKLLTLSIEDTIEQPFVKNETNNIISVIKPEELFNMIQIGNIDPLKKLNYNDVDFNVRNDIGLTPLHMALRYGDTTFLKLAFKLGAKIDTTTNNGLTLLELACQDKDPNMINFLINYGANMKKHLFLRQSFKTKITNNQEQIDIAILLRLILAVKPEEDIKELDWIFTWIKPTEPIGMKTDRELNVKDLVEHLAGLLKLLDGDKAITYMSIIKEELTQPMVFKLGCPTNKLQILLYNLYPFLDYPFPITLDWLISLEIKYLILKLIRSKKKINTQELRNEIGQKLYDSYIKTNILSPGLIQILIIQWICKIKV